jgi:hypothetical protein
VRNVLGSVLRKGAEPELRFSFGAGTGLESIEGLLPYSVSICKRESIEAHHNYFRLLLSGLQSALDSCSANLPSASHGFLSEWHLTAMPDPFRTFWTNVPSSSFRKTTSGMC